MQEIHYFPEGTPKHALPPNSLVCDLYQNAMAQIADGSVDCVIIDPPYTDGITDALPNHKIQTKIDINHVIREAFRVLKKDGFFAFFGQYPTIHAWLTKAFEVFRYKEHITWAKRNVTSPYLPINRCKEELFIFAKGNPKYHETKAKYEDLKVPALYLGVYDYSTMKTTFSDLQRRVKDNAYNLLYFQGLGVDNSLDGVGKMPNIDLADKEQKVNIARGDHNDKTLRYTSKERVAENFDDLDKEQKPNSSSAVFNDEWRAKKWIKPEHRAEKAKEQFSDKNATKNTVGYQDSSLNDAVYTKGRELKSAHRYRSKHWCNVLNLWTFIQTEDDNEHERKIKLHARIKKAQPSTQTIWSYLSQNQTKMGKDGENWKHPTVKPLLLAERLIELLTPKSSPEFTPLVLDMFVGSGTTAIATYNTKRAYIGIELQRDYYEISKHRIELARAKTGEISTMLTEPKPNIAAPQPPQTIQTKLF